MDRLYRTEAIPGSPRNLPVVLSTRHSQGKRTAFECSSVTLTRRCFTTTPAASTTCMPCSGKRGDWVELGGADEQKPAKEDTVEAWGRSPDNPIGGWYGLKKGLRGRFGVYIPPLMEELGLCELEHNARNSRMRAKQGV